MANGELPYPNYKDERDTGQRRSGRTMRIVDFLVQEFFINGEAKCFDHYHRQDRRISYQRDRDVMRLVVWRLKNEYHLTLDEMDIEEKSLIIKNKINK